MPIGKNVFFLTVQLANTYPTRFFSLTIRYPSPTLQIMPIKIQTTQYWISDPIDSLRSYWENIINVILYSDSFQAIPNCTFSPLSGQ